MTKEEQNHNELIAEFMGGLVHIKSEHMLWYNRLRDQSRWRDELIYERSWDWLMPVVEKIEELSGYIVCFEIATVHCSIQWDGNYSGYTETITIEKFDSKIQMVYSMVVRFITWYNTNKHEGSNPKA